MKRYYRMQMGGFEIVGDVHVSDIERRSWRERLFSRPWRPLKKTKYSPTAYIVGNQIIVSIQTFLRFEHEKC